VSGSLREIGDFEWRYNEEVNSYSDIEYKCIYAYIYT
jgi:hypothetical protein